MSLKCSRSEGELIFEVVAERKLDDAVPKGWRIDKKTWLKRLRFWRSWNPLLMILGVFWLALTEDGVVKVACGFFGWEDRDGRKGWDIVSRGPNKSVLKLRASLYRKICAGTKGLSTDIICHIEQAWIWSRKGFLTDWSSSIYFTYKWASLMIPS